MEFRAGRVLRTDAGARPRWPHAWRQILTVLPENLSARTAVAPGSIVLFDPASGALLAVTDGRYITEARTAAVSAVSVRHMARADAKVLAILGSGVQAHSHMEALPLVREFHEIRVLESQRRATAQVHRALEGRPPPRSAEEAVRGADVIVLATSSTTPVIDERVGRGRVRTSSRSAPAGRRLAKSDPRLVARSLLVVDSKAAAMKEAGDILLAIQEGHCTADHIHAELGEIAAGAQTGPRRAPAQITLFKSLGLAIEDVVSAGLAYRRAIAGGRGIQVAAMKYAWLRRRRAGRARARLGQADASRRTLRRSVSIAPAQLIADGYDTATLTIDEPSPVAPRITIETPHAATVQEISADGARLAGANPCGRDCRPSSLRARRIPRRRQRARSSLIEQPGHC